MSEKEKRILDTFEKIMPDLTELDKEKLLAFGEGIAFKINQQQSPPTRNRAS